MPGLLLHKANKKAYASALTLLWALVMLAFSFDWQYHRSAFVVHYDSPLEIAEVASGNTRGKAIAFLDNAASSASIWLADAMLVCWIDKWPNAMLPRMLIFIARFGAATSFGKIKNGGCYHFLCCSLWKPVCAFLGPSLHHNLLRCPPSSARDPDEHFLRHPHYRTRRHKISRLIFCRVHRYHTHGHIPHHPTHFDGHADEPSHSAYLRLSQHPENHCRVWDYLHRRHVHHWCKSVPSIYAADNTYRRACDIY